MSFRRGLPSPLLTAAAASTTTRGSVGGRHLSWSRRYSYSTRNQGSSSTSSSMFDSNGSINGLRFAVACLPAFVWVKDSLVDVYKVQGTSMEPTLKAGDVVLVRKCEAGALWDVLGSLLWFASDDKADGRTSSSRGGDYDDADYDSGDDDFDDAGSDYSNDGTHKKWKRLRRNRRDGPPKHNQDAIDRARLLRHEQLSGVITHAPMARVYDSPPIALPQQIVVFKDPTSYYGTTSSTNNNNGYLSGIFSLWSSARSTLSVKRVIGVGGQIVQSHEEDKYGRRRRPPPAVVPPYFLHVEGDNPSNSLDSRQLGPIGKGLLVGVVEHVVWPPKSALKWWNRTRTTATTKTNRGGEGDRKGGGDDSIGNDAAERKASRSRARWP